MRFGHRQKRIKSRSEFRQLRCREVVIDKSCGGLRHSAQVLMKAFLKAGDVDVETENLGGEGVLGGKFLRAMDTALPGRSSHKSSRLRRADSSNNLHITCICLQLTSARIWFFDPRI